MNDRPTAVEWSMRWTEKLMRDEYGYMSKADYLLKRLHIERLC